MTSRKDESVMVTSIGRENASLLIDNKVQAG